MRYGYNSAAKNHKHSVNNPYAQFRAGYDEAAVLASPQISNELTKYMCSPTSVAYNIGLSSRPLIIICTGRSCVLYSRK